MVFPLSALAAEPVRVEIPVSVELSGEAPSPEETYTVVLQAVDNAPMPENNTLTITGAGTASFSAISYSTPGVYSYTVAQQAGSHERGHYDTTTYYVKVTVTVSEDGTLEAVVAARKDAQMTGEKQSIIFTNTYDPAETPTQPADPGDNGGSSGDGGNSSGNDNSQTTPAQTETSAPQPSAAQMSITGQAPKTGDNGNAALWISLFVLSGCGLLLMIVKLYLSGRDRMSGHM